MDVEEHEQIGGSVALIFAIVALKLAGLGWDRRANLADELDRALVEADHWAFRIERFGIEIEHVLHPSNVFSIDCGMHHMSLSQGFKRFRPSAGARKRDATVCGERAVNGKSYKVQRERRRAS